MDIRFPERVHIHTSGGGDGGAFGYIVIGLLVLAIIAFVVVVAIKVSKMRREEAARQHAGLPPNPDFPMTPDQVQKYAPQQQTYPGGYPPPGYPQQQPYPQQPVSQPVPQQPVPPGYPPQQGYPQQYPPPPGQQRW